MEIETIIYFSGLFDGEGSFSINWKKIGNKYLNFNSKMTMSLKYGGKILEELKSLFGGQVYYYKDGMTRWNLSRKDLTIQATNEMLPFLKVKKEIAIEFLKILELFPKTRKEHWTKEQMNEVVTRGIVLNPFAARKRTLANQLLS
jgi:hypothetical protein